MDDLSNIPTVTRVIQQALTPVFLVGGVGTILNVLIARLARIVDRFRILSESDQNALEEYGKEISTLPVRVRLIHWAIYLCTACILFICASIVILFVGVELGLSLSNAISLLFIAAMLTLTGGLLCFLREVTLATDIVKIKK